MPSTPPDPDFAARVRASFARQRVMETIGAKLTVVDPGRVEIELPYRRDLTQQHDFIHAGIVDTILDSACGYAAFSLMPVGFAVLTVEYKINLLRPAEGDRLIAKAHVVRAGKSITVCLGDAFSHSGSDAKHIATMIGTIMAIPERNDLVS
ncbi:MAG: PaaI family thioesterase [Candidatus Acidiferrum sp.]